MTDETAPNPIASVARLMKEVSAVACRAEKVSLPNGLVFIDLAEYSLVDDLWGGVGRALGDSCEA